MISKPKILITLTDLRWITDDNVRFSVTDGQATLTGTGKLGTVETTFFGIVGDLIKGNPTYQQGYVDFTKQDWPVRSVRLAIDSELINSMISNYHTHGDNSAVTKLDEGFINLFDKINGNTAVSSSVGIAHLVKSFQDSAAEQDSVEPEMNWSDKLANIIYDGNAWDPEQQGVVFIQEVLENDIKIDLNVVRAVGNVFVSGSIGKVNVRIFKSQFINAYTSWDTQFTERSINFQLHDRNDFVDFIKGLTEVTP